LDEIDARLELIDGIFDETNNELSEKLSENGQTPERNDLGRVSPASQ
jgi:hypothetical protein